MNFFLVQYLCLTFFLSLQKIAAKDNYLNYHREIIEAENKAFKGCVSCSLQKYREVFYKYKKPFARDCFIAAQIATLIPDNFSTISEFLGFGFNNGLNLTAVYNNSALRNYMSKIDFKELDSIYSINRNAYIKSLNYPLRTRVLKMLKEDDDDKVLLNKNKITAEQYVNVLEDNIREIQKLITQNGFPGEHLIGIVDPELDSPQHSGKWNYLSTITERIFFHHGCGYQLLSNELLTALLDGELHPKEYAIIYEWSFEELSSSYLCHYYKLSCQKLQKLEEYYVLKIIPQKRINQLSQKEIKHIDTCRQKIGLQSIEHEVLKKDFEAQHFLDFNFGFM